MRRALLMLLAPLPALIVGVLVMRNSGVSSAIWGQQLGAGVVMVLVGTALAIAPARHSPARRTTLAIVAGMALLLLIATLPGPGLEGVRRWVRFGPVQLHAAFVALPVLLIVAGALRRRDRDQRGPWSVAGILAVAAAVLALQPDASQGIAFAVAVIVMLRQERTMERAEWLTIAFVVTCALISLASPDPLDAVPHVEGIVLLAADMGPLALIVAVASLVLLPIPFAANARHRRESMALAAYFAVVCIAPLFRPYPVPLLGFGLSPILGYLSALGWLIRRARSAPGLSGSAE